MIYEGAVTGTQIVLYSFLMVVNFEKEVDCEAAAKIVHKEEYIEGECWKSYRYVHSAPMKRQDDLWRNVSGGRE